MAEKNTWQTRGSSDTLSYPQVHKAIQELSKAWETLSNTKATLRHIENKLDVAPTSPSEFDPVMETKRQSSNATRKISRKDGRYLDSGARISKLSQSNKSKREKSSRSPLRVTTLESNVKATSHVAFREPLASYREALSDPSALSERSTMQPSNERFTGAREERDFDSTRSSAIDETSVRYLNDRPAIDALEDRLPGPFSDVTGFASLTDHRGIGSLDSSHPVPSFSPSSQRLETLKRRQPDAKLEKLKERIRRQWEVSGERDGKERLPGSVNYTETVTSAKTRKVASAPPPPVYQGFNPPVTKIRTPDGKLWQEEEFNHLSAQLYGNLLTAPQEKLSINEKSQMKRTSRPVRKVQRFTETGGSGSPEGKTVKGHLISTSSWREGQKLVKQILGPGPKLEKESKPLPSDSHVDKVTSSAIRQMSKRHTSSERQRDQRPTSKDEQPDKRTSSRERQIDSQTKPTKSVRQSESGHYNEKSCKDPTPSTSSLNNNTKSHAPLEVESTEVKKEFLAQEIRGILDDLQLDSRTDVPKQTQKRSHSPTKRKSEKGSVPEEQQILSKRRHYDTEQVRLYILRQQEERKKRQAEEREAHRLAEEQKNKRLQELYQKQKEAFCKTRIANTIHRLQVTETHQPVTNQMLESNTHPSIEAHARLLLGHTWSEPIAQEKRPLYQPSGESDKENKGQERSLSASSSSDLSLSEPLLRSNLMETYCRQTDQLTSKSPLPPTVNQAPGGTGILSKLLTIPIDFDSLLNSKKSATSLVSDRTGLQGKPPANNFRSNLDRIETLKATAVSLSSRIESEAKKLAGGSLGFQSAWDTAPEPNPHTKPAWKKPDSPPERECGEDAFSARIQKMLSTCTTHFPPKDLPGAISVYQKLPEEFHLHATPISGKCEVREEEQSIKRDGKNGRPPETSPKNNLSQNSSLSSISEGPLLSDGSLSEGDGVPSRGSPLNAAEVLKSKEFCIRDAKSFEPIAEFQRAADKYAPLPSSSIESKVKGPWEELAKGSPNSVINIFTKSYHLYGKVLDGQLEESIGEYQVHSSINSRHDSISYKDDFTSFPASETTSDTHKGSQSSVNSSASSIKEELPIAKHRSEVISPHSSGTISAVSSPSSSSSQRGSKQRKGRQNGINQLPLELNQGSLGYDHKGQGSRSQSLSPGRELPVVSDTDSTVGEFSAHSVASSIVSDSGKTSRSHHPSVKETVSQVPVPPGHLAGSVQGSMRFSPAVLQQHMSAELNYLSAMEESVRQLCDVERARGISLAQQETVSLAQILKAQQQRHEQNMAALRQQAEQEAQASLRQLEETRQKAAQAQVEILQRFQKTQETSASHKSHRIHEDMERDYLSSISSNHTSLTEPPKRSRAHATRKKGSRSVSPSSQPNSSSSSSREHVHSNSSAQESPPPASMVEGTMTRSELDESIQEELRSPGSVSIPEDITPSIKEKDTSSPLSVKEEGIEELSFRSLLPSESHRRGSLERQRSQRHESDEESTPDKELSGPFSSGQDSFWRFTMEMVRQYMQEGEMRSAHQSALLRLRQKALKDKTKAELAWLEHQKRRLRDKGEDDKMPPLRKRQRGLLLRLQQEQAEIKRLQEANKAARRERQLILKQQEEIQRIQNSTLRLQEKLKSAESGQLELPSEGDVQPSSLSSRLPSDADSRSHSPVSVSGSETSSIMQKLRKMHSHTDAKDICPVHCFFSVFTPQHWASLSVCFPKLHPKFQLYICRQLLRFLTKREQQLVQRRLHAQELLEWKRRLDAEELEIRQIEKQALAAWERPRLKTKTPTPDTRERIEGEKESREESPIPLSPLINSKTSASSIPEYVPSESIEPSTVPEQITEQSVEHSSISEDLVESPPNKESTRRSSLSMVAEVESSKSSLKTVGQQQIQLPLRPQQLSHTWSEESLSVTHSETTSDQSDIEGRVRALKDELRKRKSIVDNLKKEQKRRQKERLRAQEAILLQQLQSYDEFIRKTQAELSGEQGTTPSAKYGTKAANTREVILARTDTANRIDSKSLLENDHLVEDRVLSDGSRSQQKSPINIKDIDVESVSEQSLHTTAAISTAKKDALSEVKSLPQSPQLGDILLKSLHSSPESSIHSEVPDEMLETQSHSSLSPLPPLNLNLRSPTPEDILSPHRDVTYSEDFESSSPRKPSVSETPREELEFSYTTTPGRDLPSEGFVEPVEDDQHRSQSPHSQIALVSNPPSQEPPQSSNVIDPLSGFMVGDRVLVSGVQPGTLRFKGETLFAEGIWAGVELDKPDGNNDGSHGGNRYFTCALPHGIFAPPVKIARLTEEQFLPHTDHWFFGDKKAYEHKDEADGYLSPSVHVEVPKIPEISLSKSTESSISELLSTALEAKVPQPDLHVDIPIATHNLEEQNKRSSTPLLNLLIQERNQVPTYREPSQEVSTISESLLQMCLKDTVSYLQNLRKQRAEKIRQCNQELKKISVSPDLNRENEKTPNEDLQPQTLPFFEEHADMGKISPEPIRNLLPVLEEQDWFDEDFGLSSQRAHQQKLDHIPFTESSPEPCLLVPHPEPAPQPVIALPQPEPFMAVPHTSSEVEQLVCHATDELWRWKHTDGDLQNIRTVYIQAKETEESPASCSYRAVVFDLTLNIFDEICSPDPRGSQPLWKKTVQVSSSYARRVRDPQNLQEVKSFLIDEVLNLLSLKKEQSHKTDWQRMIKFGRKKKDRVDHILVQELHEEEAQWVNYDEDELFVKMQLADGIFEALIRDTVNVLQRIQEKRNSPLLV
ncbi:centrosome-associated protein 350 isoform X2 [Bombina bombina]|uniref:centrosome-associated protein 350 isoform X2 n=1 Tax=Bombina bombina TaxID=8345 RepID=UPI00235B0E4B|nr:centrosome-associated protein 350 isoform X2 [Bombina bombina]